MSWVAVGVAGASLVGTVVASNASSKAAKAANASAKQNTDFSKQQYEDWKAVYGPIQNNLSAYYSNLSPDYYATVGLENYETERQSALEDLGASLAQRGIQDSGVAAKLKSDKRINAASDRATIRRNATQQVMDKQQGFLAVGMGNNPTNNYGQALANDANYARQTANTAAQATGQAYSSAATTVGSLVQTGLAAYNKSGTQAPAPISSVPGTYQVK